MMKFDGTGKRKTVNKHTTTKFSAEMVIKFLELMREGGTIVEFCRQVKISRDTFDSWIEKYPTMASAKAMGKIWAEAWWLLQARDNLVTETEKHEDYTVTRHFNTNLYKFIMGGRFSHSSDKNALERLEKLEQILLEQHAKPQGTQYAEEAQTDE